ncbi:primosomal protein N' [Sulfurimonas paralvinellae]|uniref:Replication restart protein PriA n=1 Tax=Sulfurimonas paralvinellae TaxID=317658 RepID=A0A7M1B5L1_9BACT|nr:primosomal protein N' [Sulfurimonas paralvinellae]QOP45019.1 primosomal protein N' [Sulfurimonas paralvinellae]
MYYYKLSIIGSPLEPFTYHSSKILQRGAEVSVEFNKRIKRTVVLETCIKPEFDTSEIIEVHEEYYSEKQFALAQFISSYYICSLGDVLALMTPFSTSVSDENSVDWECGKQFSIELSRKQNQALNFLKQHKVSLLFGDTGSGKTEVYMKYFEEILAMGKRALFLMPEISLTPQMSERLKVHFGDLFVIWHSKLTPLQKKKALQKIYSGEAKIIAGARSCLFLPVKNLGLIVVDEEHDESYKSSSRPRYNARDIAIYMGKLYDIPVALGSATPSLSSYVKFPHARLKGGHFVSQKEFVYEKAPESLTPLIENSLRETLEKEEQSIVFLPTRANFKYLVCGDCGHAFKCAFCSVGMSLHQHSRALKCHYCNFTQAIPQVCPQCQSSHLVSSRLGTAEAVKNIQEFLPHARIEQFDRDTITTANKLKKALKRFNDKESDILVGTQMLSKGHDYHDVTLAVVLGMDNMLNMGDYRAREKALSSLIQVAGRSGRAKDAHVIVQTFNEDFFKSYIENYELFLEDEKVFREELYPPFKKLCRILFAHKNGAKAQEAMREMEANLRAFSNVEIVGAKKCAIEKVANKYRFEILLRADKSTDIIKAVKTSKVALAEVDMDPIEFG